ncbi:MAG UNVERIFIED_CONTAM: hypothetical protein LVR18_19835 [Planctomycetaceae bacterium]|jgi:hypothetical protein
MPPSGRTMILAICRECGCRELASEESVCSVFDFEQIAAFLNSTLKLQGVYETRVAGHLWWLARRGGKESCGISGWCGNSLAYRKRSGSNPCWISVRPIVLTMAEIPVCPLQATWWPAVARLSQMSHWQDGKLEILLQPLADIVRHQDEWLASRTASQRKTPHSKTIRRHVRAEINSMISNEMYAAAYRQHQSYRKAAEELSRQTGSHPARISLTSQPVLMT